MLIANGMWAMRRGVVWGAALALMAVTAGAQQAEAARRRRRRRRRFMSRLRGSI